MNKTKPGPKPIKNMFGFLDESGHLAMPHDNVFTLGLLIIQHPTDLHRAIVDLKSKNKTKSELKFTDIANHNLKLYKELLDTYFSVGFTHFSAFVFDKNTIDIKKYHNNSQYNAYNSFTAKIISESLDVSEYIAVVADDVTTPKEDNFEKSIKNKIKSRLRRNALFGIIRAESHAFTLLQLTDVLTGLVSYSFKIKFGQIKPDNKNPKLRVLKYLQSKLNEPVLSKTLDRRMSQDRVFKIKHVIFPTKK